MTLSQILCVGRKMGLFVWLGMGLCAEICLAKPSQKVESLSPRAEKIFEIRSFVLKRQVGAHEANKTKKAEAIYQVQIALPRQKSGISLDKSKVFYTLDGGAFVPLLLNLIAADSEFQSARLPVIVGIGHEGALAFDRAARVRDYLPRRFVEGALCGAKSAPKADNDKAHNDVMSQRRANLASEIENAAGEEFGAFMLEVVAPFVEGELKRLGVDTKEPQEKMLFGHSFGGVFVLSALLNPCFAQKGVTHYVSASPSLWAGEVERLLMSSQNVALAPCEVLWLKAKLLATPKALRGAAHLGWAGELGKLGEIQNLALDSERLASQSPHGLRLLLMRGGLEEENCEVLRQMLEGRFQIEGDKHSRGSKINTIQCLSFEGQSHGSVIPYALKAALLQLMKSESTSKQGA